MQAASNRITSATISHVTISDTYDGDGKRATKTVGSATATYTYDVAGSLPEMIGDGTTWYVFGLGLLEQIDASSGRAHIDHADGLGSVRALTNASGTLEETYLTDAFGNVTTHAGGPLQPYQFAGEQHDSDTNLIYLRARYDDPGSGWFMSRDTLFGTVLAPLSLNPYTYVENNPVWTVDPSGLQSKVKGDTDCFNWASHYVCFGPGEITPGPNGLILSPAALKDLCQAFQFCPEDRGGSGGTKITFGHGDRHAVEVGVEPSSVETAIAEQIRQNVASADATGAFWGQVTVSGVTFRYRAFTLPDGTIEVGTYFPVKR